MCYIRLFDIKIPDNDMKKIETYRSISEVYVKFIVNSCAFVAITTFINALY